MSVFRRLMKRRDFSAKRSVEFQQYYFRTISTETIDSISGVVLDKPQEKGRKYIARYTRTTHFSACRVHFNTFEQLNRGQGRRFVYRPSCPESPVLDFQHIWMDVLVFGTFIELELLEIYICTYALKIPTHATKFFWIAIKNLIYPTLNLDNRFI